MDRVVKGSSDSQVGDRDVGRRDIEGFPGRVISVQDDAIAVARLGPQGDVGVMKLERADRVCAVFQRDGGSRLSVIDDGCY